MFRFILNFFLFGLLFFLISRYFPQAFETLIGWVENVWEYLLGLGSQLVDMVQSRGGAE